MLKGLDLRLQDLFVGLGHARRGYGGDRFLYSEGCRAGGFCGGVAGRGWGRSGRWAGDILTWTQDSAFRSVVAYSKVDLSRHFLKEITNNFITLRDILLYSLTYSIQL